MMLARDPSCWLHFLSYLGQAGRRGRRPLQYHRQSQAELSSGFNYR